MQTVPVTAETKVNDDKHHVSRIDILQEEANNWQWPWILTPLFLWQFCRYLYAIGIFFGSPEFPLLETPITGHDGVTYHYANHLLNTAVVHSSPSRYFSGAHLFMAASWLIGLLIQRQLIVWMSKAATSNNWDLYNRWKIVHRYLGISLCLTCIIGSLAGSMMAFFHHQSAFMWVVYVIILPSLFIPWLILIWYSGRQARNSIEGLQRHRFWVKWGLCGASIYKHLLFDINPNSQSTTCIRATCWRDCSDYIQFLDLFLPLETLYQISLTLSYEDNMRLV